MTGISIVPKIQKGIEFEQMVPRNLMTMLLPPECPTSELHNVMKRNGYAHFEEIEPKAGCRRFRLF